jgi:hypothetical protein
MPDNTEQTPSPAGSSSSSSSSSSEKSARKLPYRKPELTALPLSGTLGGARRRDKENPVFFLLS